MAVVQMTKRQGRFLSFEHHEVIADGATGDYVLIPPLGSEGTKATCTVIAGAGTGKFQHSTSTVASVEADTAVWIDWDAGDTTLSVSDTLMAPVTALRGVSVSGEVTIDILI